MRILSYKDQMINELVGQSKTNTNELLLDLLDSVGKIGIKDITVNDIEAYIYNNLEKHTEWQDNKFIKKVIDNYLDSLTIQPEQNKE